MATAATGTDRRRRRGRILSRRTWSVGLVLMVAGLLFSASATAARQTGSGQLRSQDADTRSRLLLARRANSSLQATNEALRHEYEAVQAAAGRTNAQARALQRRIDTAEPGAGLTAVSGRGVVVTLDDAPASARTTTGASAEDLVVHQQDVQAIVNALWAGGATAVELMNQRLISTSAVRCVGNTLILQGRVYSPPYVVKAVGDQQQLVNALDASPTIDLYREYVAAYGLGYDVSVPRQSLQLPAYRGSTDLSYAHTPTPTASATGGAAATRRRSATSSQAAPSAARTGAASPTSTTAPTGAGSSASASTPRAGTAAAPSSTGSSAS